MDVIVKKGTLLYRGIDCPPEAVQDPLAVNSGEKVLWLAENSAVAQTYIPSIGCRCVMQVPERSPYNHVRPDDGIVDDILRQMGVHAEVLRREWPIEAAGKWREGELPRNAVNGTFGRPMSWRWHGGEPTWDMIIEYLKHLGYSPTPGKPLPLKTGYVEGKHSVLHAHSWLRGSLAIYRAKEDIPGLDMTGAGGDLLDPDYHRGAAWAEKAGKQGAGFVKLGDYCQTEHWGNVGHSSLAMNQRGADSLEVVAIIPARHREWEGQDGPWGKETIEEKVWRIRLARQQRVADELQPISPAAMKQAALDVASPGLGR